MWVPIRFHLFYEPSHVGLPSRFTQWRSLYRKTAYTSPREHQLYGSADRTAQADQSSTDIPVGWSHEVYRYRGPTSFSLTCGNFGLASPSAPPLIVSGRPLVEPTPTCYLSGAS